MSNHRGHEFDTDPVPTPSRSSELSANAHWIFGSIYAALALVGFGFGVWAGAPKSKPVETASATKDADKPAPKPATPATNTNPTSVAVPVVEPKKEPEPKPREPEPKPKESEPRPKPKEPEPKRPDRVVSYKQIEPILKANCNECHGDTKGKPKGNVDTRTLANIRKSKGPPLVEGKPMDSTLYLSVRSDEMPPDPRKKLTDEEKQLIRDWIAGGAKERRRTIRGRRPAARRKLELTPAAAPG